MSVRTIRPKSAGESAAPRPAASLVDAMAAVLEGEPDRPILLAEKVYVRAAFLVQAMAPEALERATAHQSISADAIERAQGVRALTHQTEGT